MDISIPEVLLNTLLNLGENDLKAFQWHLKNGMEGFTPISKGLLEKADRYDTVDEMVKKYGPSGAAEITLSILNKINQNQHSEELRMRLRACGKTTEDVTGLHLEAASSTVVHSRDSVNALTAVGLLREYKKSLQEKYECIFEGIAQERTTALENIYTEITIVEGERKLENHKHQICHTEPKDRAHFSWNSAIGCNDIFRPMTSEDRKKRKIRTVLTKGIAGIGKTVSVYKFILDWAKGIANHDVDLIFLFPFRELNLVKNDQYSLHKLLIYFYPELETVMELIMKLKLMFIFDGLDEAQFTLNFACKNLSSVTKDSKVHEVLANLIKGKLLPNAYIWITSRPAAANQIPSEYIHRVTEIQGFNDTQKEEYFRKRISDLKQANRIISYIKCSRTLHGMCYIPIFCQISATVLHQVFHQNKNEIPKSLTEMYTYLLLMQTYVKQQKYENNIERDSKKLFESNRTMLLKLSELAFKQLMKGNVMFYEEDLRECGIDVMEASVHSGICTETFIVECGFFQRKVYCFVHLSFQEFLAAFYVFQCYVSKNMEELQFFTSVWSEDSSLEQLLLGAVNKALSSENGHLDLFLRFLLGISLISNQKCLQGLLTHVQSSSDAIEKTVQYIKSQIQTKDLPPDKSINLFLCLTEVNDQSLSREIQEHLKSEKHSDMCLSAAQCSAIAYMFLTSEEVLEELDLRKYNTSEEGYKRLIPVVSTCRKAVLAGCSVTINCAVLTSILQSANSALKELDLSNNTLQNSGIEQLSAGLRSSHCVLEVLRLAFCNLTEESCTPLISALQSKNLLKVLDLSNNDLQNSGVELLSVGLKSSHCRLQILRLSGCVITEEGCSSLASALSSNPSHLKELDLTYNHPGESGKKLLSARLEDPQCSLNNLRVEHGGKIRINRGLKKYSCELSLDPNTAHSNLSLSKGNKKVVCVREQQSFPDHPERFDYWEQVLCRESLSGRCYWEAEWSVSAAIALTYKAVCRKGNSDDCVFGYNDMSWRLYCSRYSKNSYSVLHNKKEIVICAPRSSSNRVGVYVDCPAGTLSFYSVSSDEHTLTHLHTFYTSFTEPLCVGFRLYHGSSVCV